MVGNRGDIEINPRLLMGPETEIRGISLWNLENNFADKSWFRNFELNLKTRKLKLKLIIKKYHQYKTIELLETMAKSRALKPVLGKRYALTGNYFELTGFFLTQNHENTDVSMDSFLVIYSI